MGQKHVGFAERRMDKGLQLCTRCPKNEFEV